MDISVRNILALAGRIRMRSGYLHMLDLLNGLADHACNVALICAAVPPELRARDIHFPVYTWNDVEGTWPGLRRDDLLKNFVQNSKDTAVHVHGTGLGRAGRKFLRSVNAPVIFTPHSTTRNARELRRIQSRAARVVALSQYLREGFINRARLSRIKISVIPPGVQTQRSQPRPPQLNGHIPIIGTVAPLEPGRGQSDFLHAVRLLLDAGKRAEFIVAGDGPAERKLRRLAVELKLVRHLTFVTRLPDFKDVITALDILVRPATVTGIGYVVLEAMAMGKPVVVAATAGMPELVADGRTGLVVPKADAAALAQALSRLLDHPAETREMGRAARQRVAELFSMERLLANMTQLYNIAAADFHRSRART